MEWWFSFLRIFYVLVLCADILTFICNVFRVSFLIIRTCYQKCISVLRRLHSGLWRFQSAFWHFFPQCSYAQMFEKVRFGISSRNRQGNILCNASSHPYIPSPHTFYSFQSFETQIIFQKYIMLKIIIKDWDECSASVDGLGRASVSFLPFRFGSVGIVTSTSSPFVSLLTK